MTMLSEDPTILVGGLAVLGGVFLLALRATQQGKFLIFAGITFGLALAVGVTEWLWVTDSERVEWAVYELRDAVARSDADAVLEHLAPNIQYGRSRGTLSPEETRGMIRSTLSNTHFDLVRVTQLRTNVGRRTRLGTAEFRVFAKGRLETSAGGTITIGTADTEWSLSFQEVEPHVWKVSRITPISVPDGVVTREREVMPSRFDNHAPPGRMRRR